MDPYIIALKEIQRTLSRMSLDIEELREEQCKLTEVVEAMSRRNSHVSDDDQECDEDDGDEQTPSDPEDDPDEFGLSYLEHDSEDEHPYDKTSEEIKNEVLNPFAKAEALLEFDRRHPGVISTTALESAKKKIEDLKLSALSAVGNEECLNVYLPNEEVNEEWGTMDLLQDLVWEISPNLCSKRYQEKRERLRHHEAQKRVYENRRERYLTGHEPFRLYRESCRDGELRRLECILKHREKSGEESGE